MAKPIYWISRILRPVLRPIYPVKIIGARKFDEKRSVFAMNHTSGWDPVIWTVWAKTPMHFMYKVEFRKSRFLRTVFNQLDFIPVSRGDVDLAAIKTSLALLEEEKIVGIFPEGTRNPAVDTLKDFRSGAAMLAIKSKSPVRPFYVWDKYKPFHLNYILVGEEMTFERFYDKKITKAMLKEATDEIRDRIDELRVQLDSMLANKGIKRRKRTKKELMKLAAYKQSLSEAATQNSPEPEETK